MKKSKIFYAKCVPQEIIDLMGYQSYDFIKYYHTQGWLNSQIVAPDFSSAYKFETSLDLDYLPSEINEFKDALIGIIDDPDFISGRIACDYYDDYSEYKLYLTKARILSDKEIEKIQLATATYEAEKIVFEKLQAIIAPLKKQAELVEKKTKAEKIKKEIDKLNKQLSKL